MSSRERERERDSERHRDRTTIKRHRERKERNKNEEEKIKGIEYTKNGVVDLFPFQIYSAREDFYFTSNLGQQYHEAVEDVIYNQICSSRLFGPVHRLIEREPCPSAAVLRSRYGDLAAPALLSIRDGPDNPALGLGQIQHIRSGRKYHGWAGFLI